MNKETLIAASVGLGLGLIVTIGVYSMKRTLTSSPDNQLSVSPTPATSPNPENAGELTVTAPEDGVLVSGDSLTVKGTGSANSFVVLLVGNEEKITTTDTNGNFSDQVTLKAGPNVLTVIGLNENGDSTKIERLVVRESITTTVTATPSAKTTPSPTVKVTSTPTSKITPSAKPTTKVTPTPTKKP